MSSFLSRTLSFIGLYSLYLLWTVVINFTVRKFHSFTYVNKGLIKRLNELLDFYRLYKMFLMYLCWITSKVPQLQWPHKLYIEFVMSFVYVSFLPISLSLPISFLSSKSIPLVSFILNSSFELLHSFVQYTYWPL